MNVWSGYCLDQTELICQTIMGQALFRTVNRIKQTLKSCKNALYYGLNKLLKVLRKKKTDFENYGDSNENWMWNKNELAGKQNFNLHEEF